MEHKHTFSDKRSGEYMDAISYFGHSHAYLLVGSYADLMADIERIAIYDLEAKVASALLDEQIFLCQVPAGP